GQPGPQRRRRDEHDGTHDGRGRQRCNPHGEVHAEQHPRQNQHTEVATGELAVCAPCLLRDRRQRDCGGGDSHAVGGNRDGWHALTLRKADEDGSRRHGEHADAQDDAEQLGGWLQGAGCPSSTVLLRRDYDALSRVLPALTTRFRVATITLGSWVGYCFRHAEALRPQQAETPTSSARVTALNSSQFSGQCCLPLGAKTIYPNVFLTRNSKEEL